MIDDLRISICIHESSDNRQILGVSYNQAVYLVQDLTYGLLMIFSQIITQ